MALLLVFLSVVTSVTALECYVSHSKVEECSENFSRLFPPFCFNRTETLEDGKTRHTFGCADWKMKTIPSKKHPFCFNPDGNLFWGNGRLCVCLSEKCNHHPHHHRKPVQKNNYIDFIQNSSTTYLSSLLLLLTIFAFN